MISSFTHTLPPSGQEVMRGLPYPHLGTSMIDNESQVHASTCRWIKSSRSGSGNCLEVVRLGERILVRDSKDPSGPRLSFSRSEWAAFLGVIRHGMNVDGT